MTSDTEKKLEESLEYTAAKQLFTELSSLKQDVYRSGAFMNSILLIGTRRTANALLARYQKEGLLLNEKIETTLSNYSKKANIVFNFSNGLQEHLKRFIESTKESIENEKR